MRTIVSLIGTLLCVAPVVRAQPVLRQRSAIVQPGTPIFIINGVRIERCNGSAGSEPFRINDLAAAAIENIEVVKGAAAVRQYGPDAVNGVITVTTKPGAAPPPTICGMRAPSGADPFGKYLYSPELVMAHQEAIGLTDRQRTAIEDALKEMQSKGIVDTQFKLASATERLTHSLARASVDEGSVLQQIDDMLALEREVKRAQMTLLVRIKNQLTAQQQGVLDKERP
jgi:TonB-dependent SusC/RagA subfamily outer membrane receptor